MYKLCMSCLLKAIEFIFKRALFDELRGVATGASCDAGRRKRTKELQYSTGIKIEKSSLLSKKKLQERRAIRECVMREC